MQHRRESGRLIVRIDRGEEVIETLGRLCRDEGVEAAALRGIGAVRDATIAYYDLAARTYLTREVSEICELLSLSGNVALADGDPGSPFVHAHATLGRRDFSVTGGHLVRATVAVTAEIVVDLFEASVARRLDDEVALKLWEIRAEPT